MRKERKIINTNIRLNLCEYPEDDTLAALAFAEVYYTLHMEDK